MAPLVTTANVKPIGVAMFEMEAMLNSAPTTVSVTTRSYAVPSPLFVSVSVMTARSPASPEVRSMSFARPTTGSMTLTSRLLDTTGPCGFPAYVTFAVFVSTVWGTSPELLFVFSTIALRRILSQLLVPMLSFTITLSPENWMVTSWPSAPSGGVLGAMFVTPARVPLRELVSTTTEPTTKAIPAGRTSVNTRLEIVLSGSAVSSSYVTTSPICTRSLVESAGLVSLVAYNTLVSRKFSTTSVSLPVAL